MPLKPEPESYCNGSGLNALSRNFKQTCTLISKLQLSDIKNYYYLLVLFWNQRVVFLFKKKKDHILDIKYYFMISEIISFDVKELFFNQIFDFKSVDWNAAKILRHSIYNDIKQIDEMLNW